MTNASSVEALLRAGFEAVRIGAKARGVHAQSKWGRQKLGPFLLREVFAGEVVAFLQPLSDDLLVHVAGVEAHGILGLENPFNGPVIWRFLLGDRGDVEHPLLKLRDGARLRPPDFVAPLPERRARPGFLARHEPVLEDFGLHLLCRGGKLERKILVLNKPNGLLPERSPDPSEPPTTGSGAPPQTLPRGVGEAGIGLFWGLIHRLYLLSPCARRREGAPQEKSCGGWGQQCQRSSRGWEGQLPPSRCQWRIGEVRLSEGDASTGVTGFAEFSQLRRDASG